MGLGFKRASTGSEAVKRGFLGLGVRGVKAVKNGDSYRAIGFLIQR